MAYLLQGSQMKNGFVQFLLIVATATAHAGAPEAKYRVPRTENGQPDLQGTWNFRSDVPLERPATVSNQAFFTREQLQQHKVATAEAMKTIATAAQVDLTWFDHPEQADNFRTSLITYPQDGRIPRLVAGVARVPGVDEFVAALIEAKGIVPPALVAAVGGAIKRDGPEDFTDGERCLGGAGPPLTAGLNNNFVQLIQAKNDIALLTEPFHYVRLVPLDPRPPLGERLRSWSGDSRGHWEGDTLVVETRSFNHRTRSFAGAGTSHDKTVTERITRVSNDALAYEATIVDAKTFQDKIVLSFVMAKSDSRIYEVACHEGNYSMAHTLAGARKEELESIQRTRPGVKAQ
jgi:hypothetical protein